MIYFASDFHLGIPNHADSLEREKSLVSWLEMAAKDATAIYLMGDIFDFWFEYKRAVPRGFVRLLGTLARLTDSGIEITVFKGNHDMWMFGYLEEECGVKTVSDALEKELNGKQFYLHHGDGLGRGERAYKLLRGFFRSGICQWLFARLHPNFGIGLALLLSRKSRLAQKNRYETYLGDDNEHLTVFAREMLKTRHKDFFIFGHRHLPLQIHVGENSTYFNLGEWLHHRTYVVFDGADCHLRTWKG
ncbi:MAG: UDP-2,3-diacylglucosamine diphosphatase [Bacteroidetes bacterium]|nr:UDP-2,3-diacylglucosamine diphosphatase [Bacteroidota bacterium]